MEHGQKTKSESFADGSTLEWLSREDDHFHSDHFQDKQIPVDESFVTQCCPGIVLSSQVVNGMQGKPKVEAKAFW
jgi:hypothetical protein